MTPPTAKPAGPTCHICKTPLRRAKIVVDGLWACPDCVYALEYGVALPASSPPRSRRLHPQEERLFPLPPAIPKKRRSAQATHRPGDPTRPESEPERKGLSV
jgi:uncharacterized Zn finger protein (UPF0148 family)